MALSSNEKRAVRRTQCREVLSDYVYRKLGMQIPPDQIRLRSRPSDPYVWSYLPSKEHLFSASLSHGTISVYDEICNGLDHSIEVVQRASPTKNQQEGHPTLQKAADLTLSDDSSVAQIRRLDDDNQQLGEGITRRSRHFCEEIREEENLMSLLDKSTQQAVQSKADAEHYRDFALAIDRLLKNLNNNVCRFDDSLCAEKWCGPSKE